MDEKGNFPYDIFYKGRYGAKKVNKRTFWAKSEIQAVNRFLRETLGARYQARVHEESKLHYAVRQAPKQDAA
ncbi:MAG: hypothetical protein ACM3KM_01920 [Acidobacteriaceae bacterium]